MNGNIEVIGVSTNRFILKQKRTYKNVNLHFRDNNDHTLKLSNGKEIIISIHGLAIEAESLLIEADTWLEGEEKPIPKLIELRFYPKIEKHTSSKTN